MSNKPKLAMLFPGQGSQSVGMGREIFNEYPSAHARLLAADETLGFKLSELCFEGPEEKLRDTRNAQPAILAVSVALFQVLRDEGITPDYVAGHSLGEYSALVASGALDFESALELVSQRAQLMAAADPEQSGSMAAILGVDRQNLKALLTEASGTGKVEAANFNCPGQIVVSGAKSGLTKLQELLAVKGGKFIPLNVSGPFHSSFMKNAANELQPALQAITWREPGIPLIANLTAQPTSGEAIADNLYSQVFSPVLWEDTLNYLYGQDVRVFVEVGPGKVLSGLVKKTLKDVSILNCEDPGSLKKALAILKEV